MTLLPPIVPIPQLTRSSTFLQCQLSIRPREPGRLRLSGRLHSQLLVGRNLGRQARKCLFLAYFDLVSLSLPAPATSMSSRLTRSASQAAVRSAPLVQQLELVTSGASRLSSGLDPPSPATHRGQHSLHRRSPRARGYRSVRRENRDFFWVGIQRLDLTRYRMSLQDTRHYRLVQMAPCLDVTAATGDPVHPPRRSSPERDRCRSAVHPLRRSRPR